MKSEYTLPLFYQYATSVIPQSADNVISGIQKLAESIKNGLNVIAAPRAMGKSTLALTIAINLAEQGKRVLYCTTQHQVRRNFARYLCNKAGVKMPLNPSAEDRTRLVNAFKDVNGLHLDYDLLTLYSIQYLCNKIYREFNEQYDYIFVDSINDILDDDFRCILFKDKFIFHELTSVSRIPIIAVNRLIILPGEHYDKIGRVRATSDFWAGSDYDYVLPANIYFPFRPEYYRVCQDERTGEDIRRRLYVYRIELPEKNEDIVQLVFDGVNCCIYDLESQNTRNIENPLPPIDENIV